MTDVYYNRPSETKKLLDAEVIEWDWAQWLLPQGYTAPTMYLGVGTYLVSTGNGAVLRTMGQALQLMGFLGIIRSLGRLYDTPDSGKGA